MDWGTKGCTIACNGFMVNPPSKAQNLVHWSDLYQVTFHQCQRFIYILTSAGLLLTLSPPTRVATSPSLRLIQNATKKSQEREIIFIYPVLWLLLILNSLHPTPKVTEWRSPPGDRPSVSKTSRSLQRGCTFFFFFFLILNSACFNHDLSMIWAWYIWYPESHNFWLVNIHTWREKNVSR